MIQKNRKTQKFGSMCNWPKCLFEYWEPFDAFQVILLFFNFYYLLLQILLSLKNLFFLQYSSCPKNGKSPKSRHSGIQILDTKSPKLGNLTASLDNVILIFLWKQSRLSNNIQNLDGLNADMSRFQTLTV